MGRKGIKHTVECHCVLPQYRKRDEPIYHSFVVFSVIDEAETPVPKHAACNNCGVIHRVYDICKSEIMLGRENGAVMEIQDAKLLLPDSVCQILESYNCEIAVWEHVLFLLQEKYIGTITLTRKSEDGLTTGKLLKIKGPGKYSLEPYSRQE